MDDLKRILALAAKRRKKLKDLGFPDPQCPLCPENAVECMELDHVAGKAHDAQVWTICKNDHAKRSLLQQLDPPPGPDPKNPLEVIARWLLSMAAYFEMLVANLRRFGEFLINLTRDGYGEGLTFEHT